MKENNKCVPILWCYHLAGSKQRPLKESKWPKAVRKAFLVWMQRGIHCFNALFAQRFTSIFGVDSDYDTTWVNWVFMEKEESKKIVPHHIASNWWHQRVHLSYLTSKFKLFVFFNISGWSSIGYNKIRIIGLTTCS